MQYGMKVKLFATDYLTMQMFKAQKLVDDDITLCWKQQNKIHGKKNTIQEQLSTKVTNQRFFGGSLEMKKEYQKALILLVLEVYFALFFYFLDYCVEPHFPQCKRFKIIFAKCLWFIELAKL